MRNYTRMEQQNYQFLLVNQFERTIKLFFRSQRARIARAIYVAHLAKSGWHVLGPQRNRR